MLDEQVSFVKACQDFFTNGTFGKKIEVAEFKELTRQDKEELRAMLIDGGYRVNELPELVAS
jgi:hypothetical protein